MLSGYEMRKMRVDGVKSRLVLRRWLEEQDIRGRGRCWWDDDLFLVQYSSTAENYTRNDDSLDDKAQFIRTVKVRQTR